MRIDEKTLIAYLIKQNFHVFDTIIVGDVVLVDLITTLMDKNLTNAANPQLQFSFPNVLKNLKVVYHEGLGKTTDGKTQIIGLAKEYAIEKVNGRIPVIVGTGGNCTAQVIEFTKWAESIGVNGALIVTPYYNKATQKGLFEHFKLIATESELPMILYNVPSRTGLNITASTAKELSKIENITDDSAIREI